MLHRLLGILCVLPCSLFAQTGSLGQLGWRELVLEGQQLYVQQEYAAAEAKFRQAMKTPDVAASEPFRAEVRCLLGVVQTNLGRYDEAEAMLKTCPTSIPAERLSAWISLASLYSLTGRYAEAERLFRQASELAASDASITTQQRALLLDNRAGLALLRRDFGAAATLLREARNLYAKSGADWDSVNATGNIGIALVMEGRLEEARAELERALRVTEALGGPSHPMLAGLLGALAQLDNREGRFADAEPQLKRALAVAGPDYPYLPELLSTYAWTLRHLHRASEARGLERRARALAATRRPSDAVSVSELLRESGKR